jgi:hypothetical protein
MTLPMTMPSAAEPGALRVLSFTGGWPSTAALSLLRPRLRRRRRARGCLNSYGMDERAYRSRCLPRAKRELSEFRLLRCGKTRAGCRRGGSDHGHEPRPGEQGRHGRRRRYHRDAPVEGRRSPRAPRSRRCGFLDAHLPAPPQCNRKRGAKQQAEHHDRQPIAASVHGNLLTEVRAHPIVAASWRAPTAPAGAAAPSPTTAGRAA